LKKTTGNPRRSGRGASAGKFCSIGLEITQFTYFQQSGGIDLDPISVELTYGLERICGVSPGHGERLRSPLVRGQDLRRQSVLMEEQQFSEYSFDRSDALRFERIRIAREAGQGTPRWLSREWKGRIAFVTRCFAAYDHCLKCSHLFNLMDARGVISTTSARRSWPRAHPGVRTGASYLAQIGAARRSMRRAMKASAKRKTVELLFEVGAKRSRGMLRRPKRNSAQYRETSHRRKSL